MIGQLLAASGGRPISPGVIGFLATFALVLVSILLFRSMTGHLRKVDYRARQQAETHDAEDERAEESSLEDPGVDAPDEQTGEDGGQGRDR